MEQITCLAIIDGTMQICVLPGHGLIGTYSVCTHKQVMYL